VSQWVLRPTAGSDLAAYRTARLASLRDHPEAYSSSWEEESGYDDAVFLSRLVPEPPSVMLGGFAGPRMVAMGALVMQQRLKTSHIGTIYGIYVDPGFRRTGVGRAIMQALIDAGRTAGLLTITLTVSVGNEGARRLYAGLGFEPYGLARRALRIGDRFVDEEHMALELG
jgi:ribosomal protein S18 acetylase RimI-like enzyme